MVKSKFYLVLFLLIISGIDYFAQDIPDLVTDRPDKTESPLVVPLNSFQIETGFVFEKQKYSENNFKVEVENLSLLTTLLRYSISANAELRMGGEYFHHDSRANLQSTLVNGIQSLMVGMKYQLRRNGDIISNIALLAHLALPFGNRELRPQKLEPEIILSFDQDIPEIGGIGINLGGSYSSDQNKNLYIYSASLGIDINDKLACFVELYGDVFPKEKVNNYFDAGLTYLFNSNLQADFSFGPSINNFVESWFINFGISLRFVSIN